MFNSQDTIKKINKTCKIFFSEGSFCLRQKTYNRFIISGDTLSKAINNYNNTREEVKVLKWFNDFWIYIDIRFEKSETDIPNTFISLSVFQGDNSDSSKKQLFRAEWDTFDNNDNHPQPHWHFYSNYSFEKTFGEYLETTEDNDFFDLWNEEKSKVIDLEKIHFAMNAAWSTKEDRIQGHIHRICDEDTIVYWFQGLLAHIKSQLEYAHH